jgi:hypothetical protein
MRPDGVYPGCRAAPLGLDKGTLTGRFSPRRSSARVTGVTSAAAPGRGVHETDTTPGWDTGGMDRLVLEAAW